MGTSNTDCRSETGITVGLIDSIITQAHILAGRDLYGTDIEEALLDLLFDPSVVSLLINAENIAKARNIKEIG